ncbi:MAG: ParA family protein [Merismopediaceae bacterium]|nr:ParA family protein [Merismopediaceae bacterium]
MKVIAISGYKGGCGKSMTSLHLARYLADKGKVLLIDSDPNRSCENWFNRSPNAVAFNVVNEKAASRHIPGNDYLVLDTPARPASSELKEISQGADLTILPCIPDAFSLQAMFSMLPDLDSQAVYRCLLTVCPPPPSKETINVREALSGANVPLFKTQIRRSAGFVKAIAQGLAACDLPAKDRVGWLDYKELGKEVLAILQA